MKVTRILTNIAMSWLNYSLSDTFSTLTKRKKKTSVAKVALEIIFAA